MGDESCIVLDNFQWDINGKYEEYGQNDDRTMYIMTDWVWGGNLYIFWIAGWSQWQIGYEVDPNSHYYYCEEDDLDNCGEGTWIDFNGAPDDDAIVAQNEAECSSFFGYFVARSESEFADIRCTDCSFSNVTDADSDNLLFESFGSIHFERSTFENLKLNNPLARSQIEPVYYWLHITGVTREVSLKDCTFSNIQSSWALIYLAGSDNDVTFTLH